MATDIAIIGPGKVGTALGVLCARAGWNVVAVGGGRRCSAQAAARAIGATTKVLPAAEAAAAGKLVLLTVPDDAIEHVCAELARAGALTAGAVVAHCCGALGSEVLASARDRGVEVGSFHPLQTFPTVEAAVAKLPGSFCFIEGSPRACQVLEALAGAIGATARRTTAQGKALYHAAAAVASNYLVTLLDGAGAMLALALQESSGVDRRSAIQALAPLVQATLTNVLELGPEQALTGPIARGDASTVRRHLHAIAQTTPELDAMYRRLGLLTVELALRKGTLSPADAADLRQLLTTKVTNRNG
jgi:predicted short-subunit dehydrogenase-like oxidoreductase (DUF2520 family)